LVRLVAQYPHPEWGRVYFYVYFLAPSAGGDWRITSIVDCLDSHPDALVFAAHRADFADRCARASARTPERIADAARRIEALFDPSLAEVTRVGEVEVSSQLLCISDMTTVWAAPNILGRRVPAGTYVVEAASVDALRLTFSRGGSVRSWRVSDLIGEAGRVSHRVGVDDALLLVGDAVAHASLTNVEAFALEASTEGELQVLYGPAGSACPTGVVSASGLGDGSYPVYLGVDEREEPVALVIDFLSRDTPFD
jgi:hypothetical protein